MITIEQMVDREVQVCLSSLVSTLAAGQGNVKGRCELASLAEQAFELACPVPDYEEAAIQEGWSQETDDSLWTISDGRDQDFTAQSAEQACEIDDIDPIDSEVYEHWAVSSWLASKLAEQGEKVDTDFAGMNVWARQTMGQQISADGVIGRIYANMIKA